MKGWEIFIHSVRLVFSNIESAFKVSLLPYTLSGLAFVLFGAEAMAVIQNSTPEAMMTAAPSGLWTGFILYGFVAVLSFLWIAVSWHRFVLLEEYPSSWFPAFRGGPMLHYLGILILIALIIIGVVLVVGLVMSILLVVLGPIGAVIFMVIPFAIASYIFYRLCPLLPSAAIGRSMTFGEAWKSTAGSSATIGVLVLLLFLLSIVVQLPNQIGGADSVIGIIYSLVVGWFMMLIGSSVLTTFYGHFIEGRAID